MHFFDSDCQTIHFKKVIKQHTFKFNFFLLLQLHDYVIKYNVVFL